MNELTKKFIRTALVLGLISGISAGLVGVVYAITAPKIAENDATNKTGGMVQIYGGSATDYIEDENVKTYIDNGLLSYVTGVYTFNGEGENNGKKVIAGEGSNSYGEISLMIGVSSDGNELGQLVIVKNTESYKSTLENNYINLYQNASDSASRKTALDNISCGATFGATLIRNIVNEGINAIQGKVNTDTSVIDEEGKTLLGEEGLNATYEAMSERYLAFGEYDYIKRGWKAKDNSGKDIGYVYYMFGTTTDNVGTFTTSLTMEVGIHANGTLGLAYVIENSDPTYGPNAKKNYIDPFNASSDKFTSVNDYVDTGATYTTTLMRAMINEAYLAATGKTIYEPERKEEVPGLDDTDKELLAGDSYNALDLTSGNYSYLTNAWEVKTSDSTVGYLYKGKGTYAFDSDGMVVDVVFDNKANITKVAIVKYKSSNKSYIDQAIVFMDDYDFSKGLDGLDEAGSGGTLTRDVVKEVCLEAVKDISGRIS